MQETAGDVGDRAGPDEEHQDIEMFFRTPQGLSGDVEDLEKRPVKKQNYDTDGDTDQDAHQDGGAVAAAGTIQLFSADILSGEAGDGDVKALGRDVRELFDLQHGSVALDAGSAEGVDETLQDEETDRIDARLQHDRNTQAHKQRPLSFPGVEITPFWQQVRENMPQVQETGDGGTSLCDHGRGSRAGDAHMKDGDKHTVQHNVQGGGDHQENECTARIPVCAQNTVSHIVEQLENNSAAVDQKVCHTVEAHFFRCLQKAENNWTGCQKAGCSQKEAGDHGNQVGDRDRFLYICLFFGTKILGNCDVDTGADRGADGGQKPGHGAGQPDRSEGGRADEISNDHAVSEVVQNLQQIGPHDRQRKEQDGGPFPPFGHIFFHMCKTPLIQLKS